MSQIFLIIQAFVVIYIFILLISVVYNLISRQFIIKKLRTFLKQTILRHRDGKYSYVETAIIKKICSDEIFPYYFIYCSNYNTWQDLANKLEPDEIVNEMSSSYFKISRNTGFQFIHAVLFKTNKLRFFIYQLNWGNLTKAKPKFIKAFTIQDIKNVDYEIDLKIAKTIKHCLPAKLHYNLNDKSRITMIFGCALTIEKLKDDLWDYQRANNIQITDPDASLNILERQDKRLKMLLNSKKINAALYQELIMKASRTPAEIMECYYNEFLDSKPIQINN